MTLPLPRYRFGLKPEPLAAQAICEGIVAGMVADHFLGRSEAAYEAALRPSVLAAAQKRGFGVYLEFPLAKVGNLTPGARKKIDAVIFYGRQVAAFEIKTIRGRVGRLSLVKDLQKLRGFSFEAKAGQHVSGWQIVAWDSNSLKKASVQEQLSSICSSFEEANVPATGGL